MFHAAENIYFSKGRKNCNNLYLGLGSAAICEGSLLDGFYENQLRQIRCYKWPGNLSWQPWLGNIYRPWEQKEKERKKTWKRNASRSNYYRIWLIWFKIICHFREPAFLNWPKLIYRNNLSRWKEENVLACFNIDDAFWILMLSLDLLTTYK